MAALQSSTLLLSSSSKRTRSINATIHVPNLRLSTLSLPKLLSQKFNARDVLFTNTIPTKLSDTNMTRDHTDANNVAKVYAILEAVEDRVEMHKNIGEQRDNWNTLLLTSVNTITLAATTMAGILATINGGGTQLLAFKFSSTLLFLAATAMVLVMNKIQPSQLAEEQRNATRLFKQLQAQIKTLLALQVPTQNDVNDLMEKVLALDKAYPLPLLGAMIEKFPSTFEPAVWWPRKLGGERNAWNEEMETEMREIVGVLKTKDKEDYVRLGNIALKMNKVLAISGPILSGVAAIGAAFVGSSPVAVFAGALATIVNTLEHGGQVGMVIEMYGNSAGFFQLLEESIEEREMDRRENGELFEMKTALKLGRSLSQLPDLAMKSDTLRRDGNAIDEFASKLF